MRPEEIERTIEFLLQHAAAFSAGMDELRLRQEEFARRQEEFARRQELDHQSMQDALMNLTRSTAQFQAWAAEVCAIGSRRLDEHDRLHQDARAFHKEAVRLLNRILDRLPPAEQ